jgi:hypothetical protein
LKTPFGLAIDVKRGELYYFEEYRIIRIKTDGSEETLIVNTAFNTGSYAYVMDFDPSEDKLYWVVGQEGVRRVNRDGSDFVSDLFWLHSWGHIEGFAIDRRHKRFYFPNAPYGRVERVSFDGTQHEAVVSFPDEYREGFVRGASGGIAVDCVHHYLYFSGGKGKGTTDSPRIYRVPLPPVLRPQERPSPPLITSIPQGPQHAGDKVSLRGRHFTNATDVVFVDDSTCHPASASFRVVDDQTLEITVPKLSKECIHPVIILQTPSGVTMTLTKNLKSLKAQAHYEYDRFAAGKPALLWMSPMSWASAVEMAITYVNEDGNYAAEGRGGNTVFAKNGGRVRLKFLADSNIYHEPFMITSRMPRLTINGAEAKSPGLKFVPVSAIQPSFVDKLATYQGEVR